MRLECTEIGPVIQITRSSFQSRRLRRTLAAAAISTRVLLSVLACCDGNLDAHHDKVFCGVGSL